MGLPFLMMAIRGSYHSKHVLSFWLCAASKAHASIYQRRLPRSRAQYIGQAHAFIPHEMMFWKPLLWIMCVFVRVHCLWHGRWTLEPGV